VYFRLMLIGLFEGNDSERDIAWRVADSLETNSLNFFYQVVTEIIALAHSYPG
jgi:hypothetical protein